MVKLIAWILVFLIYFNIVYAAESWNASHEIYLSHNGTNQTWHEVLISFDQTNFSDMVFTNYGRDLRFEQDGTELDYYILFWNTTYGEVWVNLTNISNSGYDTYGSTYINISYGGSEHDDKSNPNATFDFFDYGWSHHSINISETGYERGWTNTEGDENYTIRENFGTENITNTSIQFNKTKLEELYEILSSTNLINKTIEAMVKVNETCNCDTFLGISNHGGARMRGASMTTTVISQLNFGWFVHEGYVDSGIDVTPGVWFKSGIKINESGTPYYFLNDTLMGNSTTGYVTDHDHIGIGSEGTRNDFFDNIMVRNFALFEPLQINNASSQFVVGLTEFGGNSISTFNITIFDDVYSTTNHTIYTEIYNQSITNVTIQSEGYAPYEETLKLQFTRNLTLPEQLINFTALGYLNQILPSVFFNFTDANLTSYINPYITNLSYFVETGFSDNETILITDISNYHIPINTTIWMNSTQLTYNISLTPNQITFLFWQNGSAFNTSGWIVDSEASTYGFNDTEMVVIHQNLSLGRVNMRFGLLDGQNHTQYYEYDNQYDTNLTENLEILSIGDWSAYIRVLDQADNPIKDAVVRAEMAYHTNSTWTEGALMGQRLTDEDGYTFFIADSPTDVLFRVSRTGYGMETFLITIGDESKTKADPIIIYLTRTTQNNPPNIYIEQPSLITKNDTFSTAFTAIGRSAVYATTDYRYTNNLGDKACLQNVFDVFMCNWIPGEDFDNMNEDPVLITYSLDTQGSNYTTITSSVPSFEEQLFSNLPDMPNLFLVIMIVILTAITSVISKNLGAGIMAFMVTSSLAGLINPAFFFLTAIIAIYIAGRMAFKANQ